MLFGPMPVVVLNRYFLKKWLKLFCKSSGRKGFLGSVRKSGLPSLMNHPIQRRHDRIHFRLFRGDFLIQVGDLVV